MIEAVSRISPLYWYSSAKEYPWMTFLKVFALNFSSSSNHSSIYARVLSVPKVCYLMFCLRLSPEKLRAFTQLYSNANRLSEVSDLSYKEINKLSSNDDFKTKISEIKASTLNVFTNPQEVFTSSTHAATVGGRRCSSPPYPSFEFVPQNHLLKGLDESYKAAAQKLIKEGGEQVIGYINSLTQASQNFRVAWISLFIDLSNATTFKNHEIVEAKDKLINKINSNGEYSGNSNLIYSALCKECVNSSGDDANLALPDVLTSIRVC